MSSRNIEDSPMLASIREHNNTAGSRARKDAVRTANNPVKGQQGIKRGSAPEADEVAKADSGDEATEA